MALKEKNAALQLKLERQELQMEKLQDTIAGMVEELRLLRADLSGKPTGPAKTGTVCKAVSFFESKSASQTQCAPTPTPAHPAHPRGPQSQSSKEVPTTVSSNDGWKEQKATKTSSEARSSQTYDDTRSRHSRGHALVSSTTRFVLRTYSNDARCGIFYFG